MRIGDKTPPAAPPAPRYVPPAEELHGQVVDAFNRAGILTRFALADALERGTQWANLPQAVRDLFQSVADGMGISDPQV